MDHSLHSHIREGKISPEEIACWVFPNLGRTKRHSQYNWFVVGAAAGHRQAANGEQPGALSDL
jgi:hypothetical protein